MNIHAALSVLLSYEAIEKGVSASKVQALIRKGDLAPEDVFRAIPERTFKRRLAARGKLKLEEADAVARILRVNALAQWAFQDKAAARAFLDLPNPALKNRIPRAMAQTDAGAREVEALLHRFVYGDHN
ncbi:MAG: antitoxin Xre/MbcA/ParS toxin-binding domain-containing protein [Hyphomicrobiales bacterium]